MSARITIPSALLLAAVAMATPPHAAATDRLPTYHATYTVEYQGKTAGTADVTVSYDPDKDLYAYASATRLEGLFRRLFPGVISVRSEFVYTNGSITPLHYWHADGKKGSREMHVEFDWERLEAVSDGQRIALEPGTLDPGTVQVALMLALEASATLEPYTLIDEGRLERYRFSRATPEDLSSDAPVLLVRQRGDGADGARIWLDPQRCFVPTRLEPGDDKGVTLVLSGVDGLTDSDTCGAT